MFNNQSRAATFSTLRASILGLMMTGLAACGGDPLFRSDGGSVTRPDGSASSASSPASSSAASVSSVAPASSSSAASSSSSVPDVGTPDDLPLVVRGEHFDRYHDTTPEQLGDCGRDTPVDLGLADDGESCNVGWTEAGEWLEYDVNLSTAGTYSLALSVGSALNRREIAVLVDGTAVGTVSVPNIGWSSFEEVIIPEVAFNSGLNTVRIEFVNGASNFSYFRIGEASDDLPTQPEGVVVAIRAGGSPYTSGEGVIYIPDTPFASAGERSTTTESIDGTDDERLYRTQRWGNFRYELPIDNGVYDVTLKMVEINWTAVGERVFNIYIEEQPVVTDLDIFYLVGNHTAFDLTAANVEVGDGSLTIDFEASVDNATISAVLVERVGSGQSSSSSESSASSAVSSAVSEASSSSEASSAVSSEASSAVSSAESSASSAASSVVSEASSSSEASSAVSSEASSAVSSAESSASSAASSVVSEASSSSEASSAISSEASSAASSAESSASSAASSAVSEASSSSSIPSSSAASSSSSIAPPPLDSDGDGVPDEFDQCPNTPESELNLVDEFGCGPSQRDSDNDGVPDNLDQCPNTPESERDLVDELGCGPSQRDSDNDGVTDDLDQCPDTPAGESVNDVGCSASQLDSDGDGVTDALDQCPNTPEGEAVNEEGCSASQRVELGQALYESTEQNCAACHGQNGEGGIGGPVALAKWDQTSLAQVIEETMPMNRAGECVGSCAENIAAYILTLPTIPDVEMGQALYESTEQNCAACHGQNGEGEIGGPVALAKWDQASLAQVIEETMPMNRAGECVGSCAEDIAAYILTLPVFVPEPEPEGGDPVVGAALYSTPGGSGLACQTCHGNERQGSSTTPALTASALSGKSFDQVAEDVGRMSTTYGFGLSEEDIADVTAFLFTE